MKKHDGNNSNKKKEDEGSNISQQYQTDGSNLQRWEDCLWCVRDFRLTFSEIKKLCDGEERRGEGRRWGETNKLTFRRGTDFLWFVWDFKFGHLSSLTRVRIWIRRMKTSQHANESSLALRNKSTKRGQAKREREKQKNENETEGHFWCGKEQNRDQDQEDEGQPTCEWKLTCPTKTMTRTELS